MTKDLKVKLFNFKNSLTLDQRDVAQIVEAHVGFCDQYSELEVYNSLNAQLQGKTYFGEVKGLLEGIAETFTTDQLLFELKDAYRKIERKNQGQIYRHPLDVLLGVINSSDSTSRMEKIVNELSVYDWVPEIKTIMWKVSTSPTDRQNYSSDGGKATTVRTIANKVAEGHIAFIQNKWFLIKEDSISITLLENHIQDPEQLRKMRLLEEAVKNCEIGVNRIDFRLSENLTLGLSLKNPGKIFLNESEAEKETTLETLFQSPLVSYVNRNFYPVIGEAMQNIDKFIDLDIVKRVTNPLRNHVECYAFNYGTGNYMYRVDKRSGSSLVKFESASGLIEDVMKELGYDLTPFFENKVTKEVKVKHKLEEAEKVITEKLNEITNGLSLLESVDAEIAGSPEIVAAKIDLLKQQSELNEQMRDVRVAKHDQMNKEFANGLSDDSVVKPADVKVNENISQSVLGLALAARGIIIDEQQTEENTQTGGNAISFSTDCCTGAIEGLMGSRDVYTGHIGMGMHGFDNGGNEDIDNPEAYRDFTQLTAEGIALLILDLQDEMKQELADQGITEKVVAVKESMVGNMLADAMARNGFTIVGQSDNGIQFEVDGSAGTIENLNGTNDNYSGKISISMHGFDNGGDEDIANPEAYHDFHNQSAEDIAGLIGQLEDEMKQELADQGITEGVKTKKKKSND